jgi:hypothetical protein
MIEVNLRVALTRWMDFNSDQPNLILRCAGFQPVKARLGIAGNRVNTLKHAVRASHEIGDVPPVQEIGRN